MHTRRQDNEKGKPRMGGGCARCDERARHVMQGSCNKAARVPRGDQGTRVLRGELSVKSITEGEVIMMRKKVAKAGDEDRWGHSYWHDE